MSSWALVVGINQYSERSKLSSLFGAVADAADFSDWVLDPAGGGVTHEHLFFWTYPAPVAMGPHLTSFMANPTEWPYTGPDFTQAPTATDIIMCVQKFAQKAVEGGATRLYVFFAGHGAQTLPTDHSEDPHNCFMAGDFMADHPTIGLVNCDDIKRLLTRIGPAELILFFDCCRNSLPLKVNRPATNFDRTNDLGHHRRLGVGRAAQDQKVAYEVPIGHATPSRGAFSSLLVGALRSHRIGGQLTFTQLDDYVTASMVDLVKPNIQTPDFLERPRPPALVLVSGLKGAVNLYLRFSVVAPGTRFLLIDEQANTVATELVNSTGHHFALPIGIYSVELEDNSILKIIELTNPGRTNVEI